MDADVDLAALPEEFHDLLPLLRTWAIPDDVDREAQVEAASTAELRNLIRALEPRFDAISAYLDGHDHLEEAAYLDALAEAAVEARFELEDRG
ncbi:MAG: hypothetical protein Q7T55_24815 [Solirubrobacteraceae bacterium]|nr:hypothetical protein [Solirubrobacteraceae bacterium]